MEFPSQELRQHLSALGLAIPADLRRSAGTVRRLARGLPITDSVWIDALVTNRLLTPFQARSLEERRTPELIQGGKYVLQTPRILHPLLSVSQASEGGIKPAVLLSRLRADPTEAPTALARLNQVLQNLAPSRDRVPRLPSEAFYDQGHLCLVSPFQAGESLSTLLVRRGRFPETIVRNLATELVNQLSAAEPYALHGDLRLSNLWIGRNGELTLLNWGLLNALFPVITIHTPIPEDAGDTLAPERIASSQRALVSSEIYSLGCLLWQLLAGRPPFTLADPLAKLTAHQTRSIPNVRTISPETSESLALLIRDMTAHDVSQRIQTFAEIRQRLTGSGSSRQRLQQFVRSFESAAPVQRINSSPGKRTKAPALAASLVLTVLLAGAAWQRDALGLPRLSFVKAATSEKSGSVSKWINEEPVNENAKTEPVPERRAALEQLPDSPPEAAVANVTRNVLKSFPAATGNRVVLAPNEHYAAGTLTHPEEIVLTTDPDSSATIHLSDAPLTLVAQRVRLEHVRLVVDSTTETPSPAPPANTSLIQIHAEHLTLDHCWGSSRTSVTRPFMKWTTPSNGGRLLVRDSEFLVSGDLFLVAGPLTAALLENVQTEEVRGILNVSQGARSGLRVPVMFNACTLRNCGPLLILPTGNTLQNSGLVSIQGADSLVDLALGEGVIELQGADAPGNWTHHVEIAAHGLVAPPELLFAISRNTATGQIDELDAEEMTIGGLLSGRYRFVTGKPGTFSRDHLQIDALPVRFSVRDPGVDATRLPSRPPKADSIRSTGSKH